MIIVVVIAVARPRWLLWLLYFESHFGTTLALALQQVLLCEREISSLAFRQHMSAQATAGKWLKEVLLQCLPDVINASWRRDNGAWLYIVRVLLLPGSGRAE